MDCSIEFENYGPFSSGDNEIILAPRITVLVGRNNSGKSSLIDLICDIHSSVESRHDKNWPEKLVLAPRLREEEIAWVFDRGIPGECDYEFAAQFIGVPYPINVKRRGAEYEYDWRGSHDLFNPAHERYWSALADYVGDRLICNARSRQIRRLAAERDISPEQPLADYSQLSANGAGATTLVQGYLNESNKNEELIEDRLLDALNQIVSPDAMYAGIRTQLVNGRDGQKWEIFLQEEGSRRLPLSSLGSGLKTIILILLNLLIGEDGRSEALFVFEEPENSLHPSLQRRLFEFLYQYSMEHQVQIVITSHAQMAINTFMGREGCSVWAIERPSSGSATIRCVSTTDDGKKVLDDLGIRASDLFQANGIIWVEGPSDRILIKGWLETLYGKELTEGIHYQFLFYGGRLLSHYTASKTAEKINIMFINRNAAIVMDSDVREEGKEINATKKRVRREFNKRGLMYWITAGKEIENYISVELIKRAYPGVKLTEQIEQYEIFDQYTANALRNYGQSKVETARRLVECMRRDDLDVLDLRQRIEELYKTIMKWNKA